MNVYEAPVSAAVETSTDLRAEAVCGVNCNWGFAVGVVVAMVGPLPGPT